MGLIEDTRGRMQREKRYRRKRKISASHRSTEDSELVVLDADQIYSQNK
jgi:hypothetical protein